MFAAIVSANPSTEPRAVDTYIVVPPRAGIFHEGAHLKELEAALNARFPALTIRVSLLEALRDLFEPTVMPIMGTAGSGNIGGRILPMTDEIEATKKQIAAAVAAFDPAAHVLN